MEKRELEDLKNKMKLCGRTQGEHAYIPISWVNSTSFEHVTVLMCTRCFQKIKIEDIEKHFPTAL